jgi:hypothetical protein
MLQFIALMVLAAFIWKVVSFVFDLVVTVFVLRGEAKERAKSPIDHTVH